ncbi:solute carrier family 38, member 1 [Reticulomyxa filosa]|uniref:Solute carrier family 38, member 1 n=1 Tax=Reticulomyxa filosa TaxID=46433 RepID=X6NA15_RETFI|nr:solute carrier family 38, member 1 [Reticulomyxa filosa]|eukprot:ETO22599.1 solute carrier family 38, member 1 [Reticulomyxa filosa]
MFGAFVSYLVAFGGLLDLVWRVIINDTDVYVYAVIGITWVVIYPLSLLKNLSALRYTSLFGVICSLYLGVLIMIEYFVLCDGDERDLSQKSIHSCFWSKHFNLPKHAYFNYNDMWSFIKNLLVCFPLFIFACSAQQFMLTIYAELTNNIRARMQKVLQRSSYVILFLYACASVFGYLTFLDGVCGNILLNDYKKSPGAVLAAIAISISMILAEPIITFSWRAIFVDLIWKTRQQDLSIIKYVLITTVFVFLGMLVALSVANVEIVFGLLGATTYPLCGFILPAILFHNIAPISDFPIRYKVVVFQAVAVALVSISSLIYQMYGIINPSTDWNKCNNVQDIKTPT